MFEGAAETARPINKLQPNCTKMGNPMDAKLVAVVIVLGIFMFLGYMLVKSEIELAANHHKRKKFYFETKGKSGFRPKC
jgi:hypothetical protein